jgi:hypothetical protein
MARGHLAPGNPLGASRLGERAAAAQPAPVVSLRGARNLAIHYEPLTAKSWVWHGNRRKECARIRMTWVCEQRGAIGLLNNHPQIHDSDAMRQILY